MIRPLVLAGLAVVAVVACSRPGLGHAATTSDEDGTQTPAAQSTLPAVLSVRVQYIYRASNQPFAARRAPAAGVEVQAAPSDSAGAVVAASGVTDQDGSVALQVPAATYWIFVPPASTSDPADLQKVGVTSLPDGTSALEWWETADATDSTTVQVELTLDVPVP
jgi:hypothetical protein